MFVLQLDSAMYVKHRSAYQILMDVQLNIAEVQSSFSKKKKVLSVFNFPFFMDRKKDKRFKVNIPYQKLT